MGRNDVYNTYTRDTRDISHMGRNDTYTRDTRDISHMGRNDVYNTYTHDTRDIHTYPTRVEMTYITHTHMIHETYTHIPQMTKCMQETYALLIPHNINNVAPLTYVLNTHTKYMRHMHLLTPCPHGQIIMYVTQNAQDITYTSTYGTWNVQNTYTQNTK